MALVKHVYDHALKVGKEYFRVTWKCDHKNKKHHHDFSHTYSMWSLYTFNVRDTSMRIVKKGSGVARSKLTNACKADKGLNSNW